MEATEPATKKLKIRDETSMNSLDVSATTEQSTAPIMNEDEVAKVELILDSLPAERVKELLGLAITKIPGLFEYISAESSSEMQDIKCRKLFVHSLSTNTTSEMLQSFFSKYGTVEEANVVPGKGYGFVTFALMASAYDAVIDSNKVLDEKQIKCHLAEKRKTSNESTRTSTTNVDAYANSNAPPPNTYGTGSEEERKLFIRGLGWNTTDKEVLASAFAAFGEVENVFIPIDRSTGKTKGYGFVTMQNLHATNAAIAAASVQVDGRSVSCSLAAKGNPKKSNGGSGGRSHQPSYHQPQQQSYYGGGPDYNAYGGGQYNQMGDSYGGYDTGSYGGGGPSGGYGGYGGYGGSNTGYGTGGGY